MLVFRSSTVPGCRDFKSPGRLARKKSPPADESRKPIDVTTPVLPVLDFPQRNRCKDRCRIWAPPGVSTLLAPRKNQRFWRREFCGWFMEEGFWKNLVYVYVVVYGG